MRAALRIGAVMCLLAAVVLAVVAVTVDTSTKAVTVVDDPSSIALERGFLGGRTIVYTAQSVTMDDAECRLLTRHGTEQSAAKVSRLRTIGMEIVTIEGKDFTPRYVVSSFPRGSTLSCDTSLAPLAVSDPSTFGEQGGLVKATAAGAAVLALVLGVTGLVLLRRP